MWNSGWSANRLSPRVRPRASSYSLHYFESLSMQNATSVTRWRSYYPRQNGSSYSTTSCAGYPPGVSPRRRASYYSHAYSRTRSRTPWRHSWNRGSHGRSALCRARTTPRLLVTG